MEHKYYKYKSKYLCLKNSLHSRIGFTGGGDNARLDIPTRKFIDELAAQNTEPVYKLSYEDARNVLNDLQKGQNIDVPTENIDIPINDSPLNFSITLIRPKSLHMKSIPVLLYLHGAGFVMGNKETHERLVRELAFGADIAVAFVNYTPSPEAKYPVTLNQGYRALEYISKNADKLYLNRDKIAIAGDSVGGYLATTIARMSKERNGPKIVFQALFYPMTDGTLSSESMKIFADGPWLTLNEMKWVYDAYLPENSDLRNPWIS
ncbi:MAG: lipase, partial [Hyperionvirus sp.]